MTQPLTDDELLALDPAFQTVCDENRDAWMDAMESAVAGEDAPAAE